MILPCLKYSVPLSFPIITLLCHHSLINSPGLHLPAVTEVCAFQDLTISISLHTCKDKRLINSFSFPFQPASCQYYSPDRWRAAKSTYHTKSHHTRCCIGTHFLTDGHCQSHRQSSGLFWFDRGLQWISSSMFFWPWRLLSNRVSQDSICPLSADRVSATMGGNNLASKRASHKNSWCIHHLFQRSFFKNLMAIHLWVRNLII